MIALIFFHQDNQISIKAQSTQLFCRRLRLKKSICFNFRTILRRNEKNRTQKTEIVAGAIRWHQEKHNLAAS